jgi:Putative MetA-pathway of phenol degradation
MVVGDFGRRHWLGFWLLLLTCSGASAQMPFYTDDTEVTDVGTVHVEMFEEIDGLQSAQYPDLRQNTLNFKLNTGLPYRFELDVDVPYLEISRAAGTDSSRGNGDTDFGVKWKIREATPGSHLPAVATSFYIELPTGDEKQGLGSGLSDYALNFMIQEPISEHTRFNVNFGILFAGNTSTGAVGIETTRGHVLTGGLSLLHDLNERWSVGAEVYGGIADDSGLDRTQLQLLVGGQYNIRSNVALSMGLLGGRFAASPKIGGQIGIAVDFPGLLPGQR